MEPDTEFDFGRRSPKVRRSRRSRRRSSRPSRRRRVARGRRPPRPGSTDAPAEGAAEGDSDASSGRRPSSRRPPSRRPRHRPSPRAGRGRVRNGVRGAFGVEEAQAPAESEAGEEAGVRARRPSSTHRPGWRPPPHSRPSTNLEPREEPSLEPEAPAGPRTIGRFIADALRAAGVRYAFTVPGESFLGLLDAFGAAGIRVVATRHEGAASFMAEAHGQLTGRPAVCLGTRAVGGANLAIGIHTARQDSTPMFAVIGQVERPLLGREAFQEIDQVGDARWPRQMGRRTEIRRATWPPRWPRPCVRRSVAGPGPVLLSLSEDLLDEPAPDDAQIEAARSTVARPSDEEIRAVIELLASATRPVILAGAGVLRARTSTELTRFAELLQVPVIAAWRRGDVISNDHPLYLGMAGMAAAPTVRERLEAADAILVLGSRLNEATTFGYSVPRPRPALGARRPRRRAVRPARRHRRSRSPRTPRRSSRPPTIGFWVGRSSTPSWSRRVRRTTPPTAPRGRPRASSTTRRGMDRASTRAA